MPKKLTTEQFVEKSKAKYGDALDYRKCVYTGGRHRVVLFCKKHQQEFTVEPNSHLTRYSGCPVCGKEQTHKKKSLGISEFISRSRNKFGDQFDYKNVCYTSINKNVRLFCKKHNGFIEITPEHHLASEYGCQICGRKTATDKLKLTKEEFLRRAKEKYGLRFCYDNLKYIDYIQETTFFCNEHGEFRTSPSFHLSRKNGNCPQCTRYNQRKMNSGQTTDQFVAKLKTVFGDLYDYKVTDFFTMKQQVKVRCIKHNYIFSRLPKSLLEGVGCPICEQEEIEKYVSNKEEALKRRREYRENQKRKREISNSLGTFQRTKTWDKDSFLKYAKLIHGDDYSYEKVNYVNFTTHVIIHCNRHNFDFPQTPQKHLRGQGCPKCIGRGRTIKDFVEEARSIHGDRYEYSLVKSLVYGQKIPIFCRRHKEIFMMTPSKHLGGEGCPLCSTSKLELKVISYLKKNTNFIFDTQIMFDWLKTSRSMPLDIYIPEIQVAIECQGLQHFSARDRFGGEEGHKIQVQRDKLKYAQCNENGIEIIYFVDRGYNVKQEYIGRVFNDIDEMIEYLTSKRTTLNP